MSPVNPAIFKKYDIRGKASGPAPDVTPEAARLIGQGIGSYLQRVELQQQVVVGRDNRTSSPALQQALMDGLASTGCQVIDIGMVSTPLVYWHAVQRGNIGGVMVTGSHLTAEYNGFKTCVGNRNLYDGQIKAIASSITASDFLSGQGQIVTDADAIADYVHDVSRRLPMSCSLKVVIDPGNGTGGLIAPDLLREWGHEVTAIYLEPDGTYPNHLPNPQDEANMRDLAQIVRQTGADVGIAFDGDADRMGAVDEQGRMIAADRVLALLAIDMLGRHLGGAVVGDVLCSQVLFDAVTDAGGTPHMAPSGHSIVKDTMREQGALLAGEMSGHLFFGEDYLGFDDGYFAMGRLLQLLAASDQPLSALDDGLPRLFSTPEYRPHCPDEAKQTVISGVQALLDGAGEVNSVDGLRVVYERGWGLLRASNTEPVLSLRFEGQTEADALAIRDRFLDALGQFPQVEPVVVA